MKVRNSFVTNSSSSSFIIAIQENATKAELRKELENIYRQNKNRIDAFMVDFYQWMDNESENNENDYDGTVRVCKLHSDESPDFEKEFVEYLLDNMLEYRQSTLGDWTVESIECSNEDEELFRCILYDLGSIFKGEKFKIL